MHPCCTLGLTEVCTIAERQTFWRTVHTIGVWYFETHEVKLHPFTFCCSAIPGCYQWSHTRSRWSGRSLWRKRKNPNLWIRSK